MGNETISKINDSLKNLSPENKVSKIERSLKNIGNIKKTDISSIKEVTSEKELEEKLFNIKIPYDGDLLDGPINYGLNFFADTVMGKYNEYVKQGLGDAKAFVTEKFTYIQDLFDTTINIKELKIRNFVDTVYSVGYSFDKKGGKYTIIDPNIIIVPNAVPPTDQTISGLDEALGAINLDPKLIDSLDEVLVERSFTGQGLNIGEMALILQEIGINPENEEDMKKLLPKDLAQAYLNYYSKKLGYSPANKIPDLNNPTEVKNFLSDSKIKGKIPNERITYIKLVQNNAFGSDASDTTEQDVSILQNAMKDFSKIIGETNMLLDGAKEAASKSGDLLKGGIPGLMKYMDGVEGLALAGGLIYLLFFSDVKKEAWISILGFTGLNVLTKAYNKDCNKGILQSVGGAIEGLSKRDIILPEALIPLKNEEWLRGENDNNSKINTLSVISKVNFQKLMDNTRINGDLAEINNFTIFSGLDIIELEKLWPAGDYKHEVNRLLTQFIKKSADSTRTPENKGLNAQKQALDKKYRETKYGKRNSFSYVIADVLIWNVTGNGQVDTAPADNSQVNGAKVNNNNVSSGQVSNPLIQEEAPELNNSLQIPQEIQTELDKIPDLPTKNDLQQKISNFINGTYTKSALINDIDGYINFPGISNNEKLALQNIKTNINNF